MRYPRYTTAGMVEAARVDLLGRERGASCDMPPALACTRPNTRQKG